MSIYVNQQEYKIVNKKESIGSFGAGPCTILILYDNENKLCSHLDALTIEEEFNLEINKFLKDKNKSKINIILTSSGLNENELLRNRILEYLRNLGLTKKEVIIEGTQIILNSENEIIIDFNPKKDFDLSNMNNTLQEELMTKARNLKKTVKKFAESRKHLPNLDEYGRQKNGKLNQRYNYSTGSWVTNRSIMSQRNRVNQMYNYSNRSMMTQISRGHQISSIANLSYKQSTKRIRNIHKQSVSPSNTNKKKKKEKKKKKKITFRPKFLQTIIKRSFMPKLTIKKKKKFKDMRPEQRKGKK